MPLWLGLFPTEGLNSLCLFNILSQLKNSSPFHLNLYPLDLSCPVYTIVISHKGSIECHPNETSSFTNQFSLYNNF